MDRKELDMAIADAQAQLMRAMGEMDKALNLFPKNLSREEDALYDSLVAEMRAISAIEDRLGDIKKTI